MQKFVSLTAVNGPGVSRGSGDGARRRAVQPAAAPAGSLRREAREIPGLRDMVAARPIDRLGRPLAGRDARKLRLMASKPSRLTAFGSVMSDGPRPVAPGNARRERRAMRAARGVCQKCQ